jgi:lipopolysaccharide/colanic/teichoic acid biosynthesis glycosyltransferase
MLSFETQKRILDIFVALLLSLMFLPVWIIVPLLILVDSGTPIFFSHKRVGQHGHDFHLFKFRSMIKDADELLHQRDKELLKKFKDGDWKLADDPRITPLGKVIRSLTIDEFPQLYNVIKGDMSLVGPRAYVRGELEEQTEKYPETKQYVETILSIKPGITGPWQTSGRNEVPFSVRAKMDAEYAAKKTIWEDISILLKTPKAMISKW